MIKAIYYFFTALALGFITIAGYLFYTLYFSVPPGGVQNGGLADTYFYASPGPWRGGLKFVINRGMDGDYFTAYIDDPDQCNGKARHFVDETDSAEGHFVWSSDGSVVAYEFNNRLFDAYDFKAHAYPYTAEKTQGMFIGKDPKKLDKAIKQLLLARGGRGKIEYCDDEKARGISQWDLDRNFNDKSCSK